MSESKGDLVHVVGGALYDVVAGLTGIVGLTPLQVVEGLGMLVGLALVVSFVMALTNRRGWSFEDPRRSR